MSRLDQRVESGLCGEMVAEMLAAADAVDTKVSEADAALIAAAPDLLAALEAVVSVADRKTVEFDQARAAIAKATIGDRAVTDEYKTTNIGHPLGFNFPASPQSPPSHDMQTDRSSTNQNDE